MRPRITSNFQFPVFILFMFALCSFTYVGADKTLDKYEVRLDKIEKVIIFIFNYNAILDSLNKVLKPNIIYIERHASNMQRGLLSVSVRKPEPISSPAAFQKISFVIPSQERRHYKIGVKTTK